MNPVFTGEIIKGKLKLEQPEKYLVHLSSLNGNKIELVLRKKKGQRSLNQNAYYWGVVVEILSKHFGYEPEEMHGALKSLFLTFKLKNPPFLTTVKSTSKCKTDEFNEYINRIVRWAASEYGVDIPAPNEIDYRDEDFK